MSETSGVLAERAERIRKCGFQLFAAGRPLGAAVFFVQALRCCELPTVWAELGCALQDCAGRFVRSPFFESAELAFRRAEMLGLEGPMVEVVAERRVQHQAELGRHTPGLTRTNAGADRFLALATPQGVSREALGFLEAFLMVSDDILLEAIDSLSEADRTEAVVLCATLGWEHLAVVARVAAGGRFGPGPALAAAELPKLGAFERLPVPPDPHATAERPLPAPAAVAERGPSMWWIVVAIAVALGVGWLSLR